MVDVLSPLLTILTPPIKPGATHLLASDERELLGQLVDHMIAFGAKRARRPRARRPRARLPPPLVLQWGGGAISPCGAELMASLVPHPTR